MNLFCEYYKNKYGDSNDIEFRQRAALIELFVPLISVLILLFVTIWVNEKQISHLL